MFATCTHRTTTTTPNHRRTKKRAKHGNVGAAHAEAAAQRGGPSTDAAAAAAAEQGGRHNAATREATVDRSDNGCDHTHTALSAQRPTAKPPQQRTATTTMTKATATAAAGQRVGDGDESDDSDGDHHREHARSSRIGGLSGRRHPLWQRPVHGEEGSAHGQHADTPACDRQREAAQAQC